ncbi:hypothetical protein K1X84_13105 [bacterium]|nr:hypothetical protein [bacterium]
MAKFNWFWTILVLNFSVQAQSGWKEMEWETYSIRFKVPESFEITESTADIFTASGEDFTLSISPWKDASISVEEVANKALGSLSADDVTITSHEKIDLNGFEGYEILGTGYQDDRPLLFVVLGFIDPDGETNFSAYILFWHDENKNQENIDIATQIIEGIGKM